MKIERIDPTAVTVPDRLRAIRDDRVNELAESMKALGLQQPITLHGGEDGTSAVLVAGRHRLSAAIKLGWSEIDAIFVDDMDEIDRQLWEIDENLMRAELTPTEQAEHLARRKELWEDKKRREQDAASQQTGNTISSFEGRGNKGFASDTAAKAGVTKQAINKAISRAREIPEDVRAQIKGTRLDKGTYLDGLKGLSADQQRVKVRNDLAASPKPRVISAVDADEEQFEALKRAWNKASSEARRRFTQWREDEETPVFDRTRNA